MDHPGGLSPNLNRPYHPREQTEGQKDTYD